jgi:VWFA-related protein
MRARLSAIAFVLVAVATLAAQNGQTPPDPQLPTFRTQTDLIRVDMYATRDGKLVTDLRPDEVEIYEDGVRQRIESFEFVRLGGDLSGSTPAEKAPAAPDARSRVFVVFVDTHTTMLDGRGDLRLSLLRFLDHLLAPTDLVGLMTPDMKASEVTLSRRSTVISDLANDARWIGRIEKRQDPKEFAWENCYPTRQGGVYAGRLAEMKARYRGKGTLDALNDLVTRLRTLREERKAVLLVTGGWPFLGESTLATAGRVENENCAADRQALERIDFNQLLKELTKTANRGNVSFYPVSSRREQVFPNDLRADVRTVLRQQDRRALEFIQDQLRSLAENTDGLAEVKTTDLTAITDRIISDTSTYYLIGYESSNTRTDGRFRTISVKVNRPGVRVRARRGYGGESLRVAPAETAAPSKPVVDARVTMALTTVERFDAQAPLWGRPSPWGPPSAVSGGAFWYVGELSPQPRSQPARGGMTAEIEVLAPDKSQVMIRSVDLPASDSSFALRVPATGFLAAGDYAVRVRLTPKGSEAPTVHDSTHVILDRSVSPLGAPVLWRRGPTARSAYAETADPRFRRTEGFRLELPSLVGDGVTARLLDRAGRQLQVLSEVSEREDDSGDFRWIVIEAPLAGLAPGDYAVEISQGSASQVAAFRVVP